MLIRHSRRRENLEKEWGGTTGSESRAWVVGLMMGFLLFLAGGGLVFWFSRTGWEDLLSGKAKRAVVRVFCEPSMERPVPFEDQCKWTCFRLSSRVLPQAVLGFTAVGSVRKEKMKQMILSAPKYRQRFTLEIMRHAGREEPLFEITCCLAVGWVTDDLAVENAWEKSAE